MNIRYFIKKNHRDVSCKYIFLYMTFVFIILAWSFGINMQLAIAIGATGIYTTLLVIYAKHSSLQGLHIEEDNMYYIGWKKRDVDINKIAGIKIVKERYYSRYGNVYVKDSNKNQLYLMLFLNAVESGMEENEYTFGLEYSNRIMFQTIYNVDAINYLKCLKPDIMIISDIRTDALLQGKEVQG